MISLCCIFITNLTVCSKNIKWYPVFSRLYWLFLIALINLCFPIIESIINLGT